MLLRSLLPAAAVAVLLATPANAAPVSVTYTTAGESVFVVPPGVRSIEVSLTGAGGGSGYRGEPGGLAATVSGRVAVTPGAPIYVEVGGPGTNGSSTSGVVAPGGVNGGGSGAAGGGGASDIRTAPASDAGSLSTRLAVAAGGGGAAYAPFVWGAAGGDAGTRGGDGGAPKLGGSAGTLSAGGAGGIAADGFDGAAGSLGLGGDGLGPIFHGGGGGGGLYGGGGGAGMWPCSVCDLSGGGGGGSSLVPAGGTSGLATAGAPAQVTIAYTGPEATASVTRLDFPNTPPGAVSASRSLEVTNTSASTELNLSGLALESDDFLIGATTCHGTLGLGEKCRIRVRFAPSGAGARTATLRVHSNVAQLAIALSGEGAAPAPLAAAAEPAGAPAVPAPVDTTTRVTCRGKRCTVAFAGGAPRLGAKARVRASLTRGGRVYASADRVARRGPLRLTLKASRPIAPGAYKLVLRIGSTRTTRAATVT